MRPAVAAGRSRLATLAQQAVERHSNLLLAAALLLLHVAALRGSDLWARALLVAHLGVVLLCQPFVATGSRLRPAQLALVAAIAIAVLVRLDAWLLAFWTVVLAGTVASQLLALEAQWERRAYLAAFVYLLALLALVLLPAIARAPLGTEIEGAAAWGLPLLAVLPALFPMSRERAEPQHMVDALYGLVVVLLLGTLVLGSFTVMTVTGITYPAAFAATAIGIGGAVLLIVLALAPPGGGDALATLFSRYLLLIGVPLEGWLSLLTRFARAEPDPVRFVGGAAEALARLPWIAGVRWRAGGEAGSAGKVAGPCTTYADGEFELRICPRYARGPALALHLQLLARLVGVLYAAKRDERRLRDLNYLRAVHETGARHAHDVKNLLQALSALAALAAEEREPSRQLDLLRGQLPVIAERLAQTLEKLRGPAAPRQAEYVLAHKWWEALRQRHAADAVAFEAVLHDDVHIPQALFDTVAENLVANALHKRLREGEIAIRVTFEVDAEPRLRVCDDGSAIRQEVLQSLFQAPVASANGFGIGLYQSARYAESCGFVLRLEENRAGRVCFALEPAGIQGRTPAATRRA